VDHAALRWRYCGAQWIWQSLKRRTTLPVPWLNRDLLHGTPAELEALSAHDNDVDHYPRLARPAAPSRAADRQVDQVRLGRVQEEARSIEGPEVPPGCRMVLGLPYSARA
jgi:hypothetical protein